MLKCSIRPCGGERKGHLLQSQATGFYFSTHRFCLSCLYCVALFRRVLRSPSETVPCCYNLFVSFFKRQYCVMKGHAGE